MTLGPLFAHSGPNEPSTGLLVPEADMLNFRDKGIVEGFFPPKQKARLSFLKRAFLIWLL